MTLGRHVLPALRWEAGSGIDRVLAEGTAALDLGVGGFILFGGEAAEVARLTTALRSRAGRPLLIAADLERGAGQQFRGLSESPPPLALASLGSADVVWEAAHRTAAEARRVGVNWVLAPVADLDTVPDNPIVQTRAFGSDPTTVARLVAAWIDGCQAAGCLATAKHFPGHGTTIHDSHERTPVVTADAATLAATDELPFRAAVDAGVGAMMTAHIRYPALDPSGAVATCSRPILDRLRRWGFDGLIVTDAMIMGAVTGSEGSNAAAVRALAAGVDLVLYPEDPAGTVRSLDAAVADGRIPVDVLRASSARYDAALDWLGERSAPSMPDGDPATVADRVLNGGLLRGTLAGLAGPLDLHVIDDDLGGPYPPGPSDWVARALGPDLVSPDGTGAVDRVILIFAEPRGWKGRPGLGPESLAAVADVTDGRDLIVLFGHPRIVQQLPPGPPILVAWHRQRLMQEAVARWLRGRLA